MAGLIMSGRNKCGSASIETALFVPRFQTGFHSLKLTSWNNPIINICLLALPLSQVYLPQSNGGNTAQGKKYVQIVCRLELRPRPYWESLQRSPDPIAGFIVYF